TMTLLLPPLDYGRSPRALVAMVDQHVPRGACVLAPGMMRAQVAALEVFGEHRVHTTLPVADSGCNHLLLSWRGNALLPVAHAEAVASGVARTPAVHAVEALGQARQMLWCDARSGVAHGDLPDAFGPLAPAQFDQAAFGRVAHRVVDQVAHRTLQLGLAARQL